ncbi:DUF4037 domain-containing protein [Fodinicola acaciae]|uniref:DUF4037 domain-containing protein n=1 Tax=Fodinicola acaciae TaxID=2681555 RepID=UPI0013D7644F|nr:DUF4037 domain-containing protein [Fodinicola acaciae]
MTFIPGLQLSRLFYAEAVRPLLDRHFPGLPHAAARIGSGSEVLGFDTARSADHEWGPRLQVFVADPAPEIGELLSRELPKEFRGYPTHFVPADNEHIRKMAPTDGPVFHRVDIARLTDWMTGALGFDPTAGIGARDWLATPTQRLAEVTGGAVFHDDTGELTAVRSALSWYPDEIWRYVLACGWQRIGQEEAFVGRAGEVGDELGSAVVAARLARELMRLCLLMARVYPPYSKWLGSAFASLPGIEPIRLALTGALAATEWRVRERFLGEAYEMVAARHNELRLTEPLDPRTRPYFSRPFRVIGAGRFVAALHATGSLAGAVDQFVDSTDVLGRSENTRGIVDVVHGA